MKPFGKIIIALGILLTLSMMTPASARALKAFVFIPAGTPIGS